MSSEQAISADDIASQVGGERVGSADVTVSGVASLAEAGPEHLSFLGNDKYRKQVATTQAGVVLVPREFADAPREGCAFVRCDNPSESFTTYVVNFAPPEYVPEAGIHPRALVAEGVVIPDSAHIGPNVVIEPGVSVGEGSIIAAGCYIGHAATIGAGTRLYPNVTVRERSVIGDRVIIHAGSVIGSDGFGLEQSQDGHRKIPQLGIVQIDDDVEIGACVTLDRARFGRTWIKRGVKIDNLVQVGHNVVIGEGSIIVAQVGIAGSVTLGKGVILAGQAGVPGHLNLGDGVIVVAKSAPISDVEPGVVISGFPGMPRREFMRVNALSRKLPDFSARIKSLEKELAALKDQLGDEG